MMSYGNPYHRDLGDQLATGLTYIVVMAAIVAAIFTATLFIALTTEIAKVFLAYGRNRQTSKVLWGSLAALLLIFAVSLLLATNPNLIGAAALLPSWAFLIFVVVVEGVNWLEQRKEQASVTNFDSLDDYIDFSPQTHPATNGKVESTRARK